MIEILITIPVTLLVALVSFFAGARYARSALPVFLAQMNDEELDELADATDAERKALEVEPGAPVR